MKQKKIVAYFVKLLLALPLLILTNCDTTEEVYFTNEAFISGDAEVFGLMAAAVTNKSESGFTKSSTTETSNDNQCTMFKYPISFFLHEENPQEIVINSDEELIEFVNSLTSLDYVSFYFPITLIDFDGVETQLASIEELEGTLQMAMDACNSIDDGTDDDNSGSGDDSTGGSDDSTGGDDNSGNGDDSTGGSDDNTGGDDSGDDDTDDQYNWCDKNNKKVSVCHNGHTICISVNALWQHLAQHDDCYLGPCDN